MLSFNQTNKILRTLPISYYLKRKINVILSEQANISYVDLMKDTIIISYPQIAAYDIESEEDIRALLYHEVSHAMLSPIPKEMIIDKGIFNIFEDERIEIINKDTFMNTDFKKTLSRVSPFKIPLTEKEYFFNLVRHRIGKKEELEIVDLLIKKYSHLAFSPKPQNIIDYQEDIKRLYDLTLNSEQSYQTKDCEAWLNILKSTVSGEEKESNENHINSDIFNYYDNPSFRKELKRIFDSKKLEKGINSSSKNTYSGRLRPKSINKPNDNYKWWIKNGDGFIKNHKKICLNLFIDQSGSFKINEDKVNSILKELSRIEKEYQDFIFNLITIDTDINISTDKKICCNGSNSLTSKLKVITRQVINSKYKNINIVLFDGIAIDKEVIDPITNQVLPSYSKAQAENFKYFNLPRTIIISNTSNKEYIEEYCYNTTRIYSTNYLKELEVNILKALRILIS